MLVLTNDYGNVGVAIARMVGFSTIFFSIFYVEKWFFDNVQIKLWLKIVGILGVSAILAALVEKLLFQTFLLVGLIFIFSVILRRNCLLFDRLASGFYHGR